MRLIFHICCQIQRTRSGLSYTNSECCHIQRVCNFAYARFNIQLKISKLLLVICRCFDASSTPYMLTNTDHGILFVLRQPSALSNPAYLQFYTLRLKYSNQRISASIEDTSTIRGALYSTFLLSTAHIRLFTL